MEFWRFAHSTTDTPHRIHVNWLWVARITIYYTIYYTIHTFTKYVFAGDVNKWFDMSGILIEYAPSQIKIV